MVDQLLALLMALDSIVPEQFIKVAKISTSSRYPHTDLSLPQTGKQLVEVPPIVSHWGDQAACRAGRPGQSSSAFGPVEQIVDIPVPRGAPRDVHQDPLRAAGSTGLPVTANQWFFTLFPKLKKCGLGILVGMDQKDRYTARCFHTVVHTPVVCNDRCHGLWGAENCGFSAVAVHPGRRHFLRCAEADSHGPL